MGVPSHITRQLTFRTFLPPRPPDATQRAAWIEQIVRGYWQHGASFDVSLEATAPTWEATLDQPVSIQSLDAPFHELDTPGGAQKSLRERIQQMATWRSATISLFSLKGSLYLTFEFAEDSIGAPSPTNVRRRLDSTLGTAFYDQVELQSDDRIGPGYLDRDEAEYDVTYLARYEEFWSWCITLCELTTPIFGLGYSDDDLTPNRESDVQYWRAGPELVECRLPDITGLFKRPPTLYMDANFPPVLVQQTTEELLGAPRSVRSYGLVDLAPSAFTRLHASLDGNTSEGTFDAAMRRSLDPTPHFHAERGKGMAYRLRTGGILLRPGEPLFTEEAQYALWLLRKADQAANRLQEIVKEMSSDDSRAGLLRAASLFSTEQRTTALALARSAHDRAERAVGLFQHVGYEHGENAAVGTLEWARHWLNDIEQS